MTAWRNFSQETSLTLRGRAFFVGPNASGKSNILDALRFMRDVAAMGLDDAVSLRGGMREVRSLHARQFRGVRIAVDAGPRDQSSRWSYELHFRNHPQSHRPVVERERIRLNDVPILDRPDEKDESDPERLTQTHLEQVSENQRFRPLAAFFGSIRYLHLVPQIVRERDAAVTPTTPTAPICRTGESTYARGETAQDPGSPARCRAALRPIRPGERHADL